ncbi:MAG TPA: glycosyl transferase family 90, partial [Rhodopila sp.]|uniref:glycosyl transferase family 90 n=1 Tax=Rhodopila sp. TaxID=2480087 RepID=UPI002C62F104
SAVFVGATTGAHLNPETISKNLHPRVRSALYFKDNPEVDFRLPIATTQDKAFLQELNNMGIGLGNTLSYKEQFKHQFIISMDGWGATCSRIPIALRSNSILLKYQSPHRLFYFDGMIPWYHFVPIRDDSDVERVFDISRQFPEVFKSISHRGRSFANTFLTRTQIMRYTACLLKAYESLFSEGRGPSLARSTYATSPFAELNGLGPDTEASLGAPCLRIDAHLSRLGDKWFASNAEVSVLPDPALIEGFSVEPGADVSPFEIEYRAVLEDGSLTRAFTAGMFCGTKGQARPIFGICFRATGYLADTWDCCYRAQFQDGTSVGPCKQGVPCRADTGSPLQAFSVWFERRSETFSIQCNRKRSVPAIDDADALAALMLSFESLGGWGHGCEFGLVQRHFNAEPLGLLRWADIGYEHLLAALETRFDGVGDKENTVVFVPENGQDEYWTIDTRYHMAMRTFVKTSACSCEQMRQRAERRLLYLKSKLIEDLTSGEKIFVYKNMRRNLTQEEAQKLQTAISAYGPGTLAYIAKADREHPHGTIMQSNPKLLTAYIDRFTFSQDEKFLGSSIDLFLDVCREIKRHAIPLDVGIS